MPEKNKDNQYHSDLELLRSAVEAGIKALPGFILLDTETLGSLSRLLEERERPVEGEVAKMVERLICEQSLGTRQVILRQEAATLLQSLARERDGLREALTALQNQKSEGEG